MMDVELKMKFFHVLKLSRMAWGKLSGNHIEMQGCHYISKIDFNGHTNFWFKMDCHGRLAAARLACEQFCEFLGVFFYVGRSYGCVLCYRDSYLLCTYSGFRFCGINSPVQSKVWKQRMLLAAAAEGGDEGTNSFEAKKAFHSRNKKFGDNQRVIAYSSPNFLVVMKLEVCTAL